MVLLSLGVSSCTTVIRPEPKKIGDYNVIVIDGCEYLEYMDYPNTTYGVYSLTHKGNCKARIHK